MSLEDGIYKTVKEALQDGLAVRPVIVKKKTLALMLDVSVDTIDKLIRERVLVEERHFTRYTQGGDPMFDVAECLAALRPKLAKEKILL